MKNESGSRSVLLETISQMREERKRQEQLAIDRTAAEAAARAAKWTMVAAIAAAAGVLLPLLKDLVVWAAGKWHWW